MTSLHRRRFVSAALLLPFAPHVLAQSCGPSTPRQTEGPFFKTNSPQRISLVEGRAANLVVTGHVLDKDCKPVANALLDFWHADENGDYDNAGFRYRGHQFTDAQGRYRLETIVPAEYPGRARHIHVKAQAPHRSVLTTQLYFPREPRNRTDGIFDASLLMAVRRAGNGRRAAFRFVLS